MRILTRAREPSFALVTETITSQPRHPMFRRSLKLAALIAVVFTLGACADGPTAPTESPKLEVEEAPKTCQGTQGAHDC
jgi:hypothetical protein